MARGCRRGRYPARHQRRRTRKLVIAGHRLEALFGRPFEEVVVLLWQVETALFTPIFAIGRSAGWMAHCFEQRASGRPIRPQSVYVGPRPA